MKADIKTKSAFISKLKQACKNRGVSLIQKDCSIMFDGKVFLKMSEIERYIESKPRIDN